MGAIIHTPLGTLGSKCLPDSHSQEAEIIPGEVQMRNLSIGKCSVCFVIRPLEKVQTLLRFLSLKSLNKA